MPDRSDIGYSEIEYMASDGLLLRGRRYGSRDMRDRLPVVCLAGLTRNSADFHRIALFLSSHDKHPRQVLALDYRGRGRSEHDKDHNNYNPLIEAADVIAGCEAAGFEDVAIIGTSRGGLIAMVLAAIRPGFMKQLILNDIGPEIDGVGWARIKTSLERSREPANWDEAVEMLKETLGRQFTALEEDDWQEFARATFRDVNGKPQRNFDPGLLESVREQTMDDELPTFWPQYDGLRHIPTLVIRGGNSDLFSAETLEKMVKRHPGLETITMEGQGHAPLLHLGDLPEKIHAFLEASQPRH